MVFCDVQDSYNMQEKGKKIKEDLQKMTFPPFLHNALLF